MPTFKFFQKNQMKKSKTSSDISISSRNSQNSFFSESSANSPSSSAFSPINSTSHDQASFSVSKLKLLFKRFPSSITSYFRAPRIVRVNASSNFSCSSNPPTQPSKHTTPDATAPSASLPPALASTLSTPPVNHSVITHPSSGLVIDVTPNFQESPPTLPPEEVIRFFFHVTFSFLL